MTEEELERYRKLIDDDTYVDEAIDEIVENLIDGYLVLEAPLPQRHRPPRPKEKRKRKEKSYEERI